MTVKLLSTLFLTYDGLLDPLGGSQILPYLYSIAQHTQSLHIVSFEKQDRFANGADKLRDQLGQRGISWTPLSFTSRFGKVGKIWDLVRMYGTCLRLQWRLKFGVIHCRSYQAMQVGCLLSRLTGARTIFDMRGLWVDERIDGGLWQQDRWLNRVIYWAYKRIEKKLLARASHIVVLTERVVPELKRISPCMRASISVIPCCADYDHFVIPDEEIRVATRLKLGIPRNALLLSYLGSLGTWYMLDEMLQMFASAARQNSNAHFLLITRDWREEHEALVNCMGLNDLRNRIHVHAANRDQVPQLLGASDIMLSFIKPAYSKIASSPTKLAEAYALGIPVISNSGVGDVDQITRDLDAGAVMDLDDPHALDDLAARLDDICCKGGSDLRARSRPRFGLEVAKHSYQQIYASLGRQCDEE